MYQQRTAGLPSAASRKKAILSIHNLGTTYIPPLLYDIIIIRKNQKQIKSDSEASKTMAMHKHGYCGYKDHIPIVKTHMHNF